MGCGQSKGSGETKDGNKVPINYWGHPEPETMTTDLPIMETMQATTDYEAVNNPNSILTSPENDKDNDTGFYQDKVPDTTKERDPDKTRVRPKDKASIYSLPIIHSHDKKTTKKKCHTLIN